jgi:hypothetical protein
VKVRLAIATGVALIVVALAITLLGSEEPSTGDNGREIQLPAGVVIPAGDRACQPEAGVPAGTGIVRLRVSTAGRQGGPLAVTVSKQKRVLASGTSGAGVVDQPVKVPLGAGAADSSGVSVCVENRGTAQVAVLGQEVPRADAARVTDPRQPQSRAMRLEWFEPEAEPRAARTDEVAGRYGLVKAAWIGTWTFWAALALLVAISAAAVVLYVREAGSR